MPELDSIRFYYVVFWIRFRSDRLSTERRERLLARFGLIAGRHGAVALAVDGAADRLYALLGIHPRREPAAAIDGIREEVIGWAGGSPEGTESGGEEDCAAIPLTPGEAAALLDIASGPLIPAPSLMPQDGWWEEAAGAGDRPREPAFAEAAMNFADGEGITS